MSKLHQISVSLTQGQKEKLARAYRNKEGVSIGLKHSALSGTDVLLVPMNTVKRVAKHRNMGVGVQITISKNNIRKQTGSGIFSAVLPALRAVAPTVAKTLGLATLAGAASEGASQIIKKISGQGTRGGSSMRIGKGLEDLHHLLVVGKGEVKKKKRPERPGTLTRQTQSPQQYSNHRSHLINKPKFHKDIPMSNFDLLEWCKYLKIPINNVLSRDRQVSHNHKLALFIYNLEPSYMSGSHWIATYVKDNVINYFDSFGMAPFQEMVDHAKKKNLTLLHQNQQIQNLYTSTCGFFCLYFLNEMHKGVDYFDLLQVFSFDTMKNEKFIEKYFTSLNIK